GSRGGEHGRYGALRDEPLRGRERKQRAPRCDRNGEAAHQCCELVFLDRVDFLGTARNFHEVCAGRKSSLAGCFFVLRAKGGVSWLGANYECMRDQTEQTPSRRRYGAAKTDYTGAQRP